MAYKIEIRQGDHTGGTKFYRTILVYEETGSKPVTSGAVAIFNYGPVSKTGQFDIDNHSSLFAARNAVDKKIREKAKDRPGKGRYEFGGSAIVTVTGVHDLRDLPYNEATKLNIADAIRFIDASAGPIDSPTYGDPIPDDKPSVNKDAPAAVGEDWGSW